MLQLDWRSCTVQGGSGEEYSAMERLVQEHHAVRDRDLWICEIGSYHGRSTVLLAQFGHVVAIDLWGDVDAGGEHPSKVGTNFAPFMREIVARNLTGRIFPRVSDSSILDRWPVMNFDIIYIDADHHYEPSRLDINRSERHLADDGLLFCHDYKRPGDSPHIGVNRAVDELIARGKFVIYEHVKGMVCLRRIV